MEQTLTLEVAVPCGELAAEDLLAGVALDRQCLEASNALRPLAERWALPPGVSPRLELMPSRRRDALATAKPLA